MIESVIIPKGDLPRQIFSSNMLMPNRSGKTMRFRRYSKLDKLKGRLVDMFKRKDEIKEQLQDLENRLAKIEDKINYNYEQKISQIRAEVEILQALSRDIPYVLVCYNTQREEAKAKGYQMVGFTKENGCEVWAKK